MTNKALIAMSGGVDSSVAAFLTKDMGYDATGITLKLFDNEDIGEKREKTCCSLDDIDDARRVCLKLGIPYYVYNFKDSFKENVIDRFIRAYENGTTPNPCIDCNRFIKFEKLIRRAEELDFDCVVTGHYSTIEYDKGADRYLLKKSVDSTKDQSYVLYCLTQRQLAKTLLPLGTYTKEKVREIANELGLINARKHDSQDSPILKTKGYNKDYPEVYGHPDDVRGKTFLITTMSSPHFTLSHWLRVLGLKESDVTIKNIDQAQGLAAFDSGIGDGVCLWAPHMFFGIDKGWKVAGTPNTCGVGLPTVLMGDKKFCDANPELVAKFLRVFLRSANMLQKETPESLAPEYCRFFQEFVGKSFTPEMAALDIKTHPVFNLEEQLALFDGSKGQSKAAKWMADIAEFFAGVGRITPDELKVVKDGSYATDKFLKLVKQPIPDYK